MTTNAILRITDGTLTGTVDLIGGPFHLKAWTPTISEYKEGGVFVDSPLSDGRRIVFKRFANAMERFDVIQASDSVDLAAAELQKLLGLLEKASDYWISNGQKGNIVYIAARAHGETNTRYANIISGRIPNTINPYAQPFMQSSCSVIQDELNILIERDQWKGAAPGNVVDVAINGGIAKDNYLLAGDFDDGPQSTKWWTEFNSPTDVTYTKQYVYKSAYSAKITGTSGSYRGIYQDVGTGFLTSGASYTVTAWVYVISGGATLIAYDGGGFTNAVTDGAAITGWQELSVTKTATGSGIRVALTTDTAYSSSVVYFSGAFLGREFGINTAHRFDPVLVSNYYGQTHLTHIFTNDVVGAGYSSNLLDASFPYGLLPSGSAIGDQAYFGSRVYSDVGGPFSSIAFDLSKAAGSVNSELFSNTTFESNLTGWSHYGFGSCGNVERTSAYGAHGGSYSARMYYNASCVPQSGSALQNGFLLLYLMRTTSTITVTGTQLRFGGWFNWEATLPASNYLGASVAYMKMEIIWQDGSGNTLGYDEKPVIVGVNLNAAGDVVPYWTYNEILGNKPAGASDAYCFFELYVRPDWAAAGVQGPGFLIDDVSAREPSAAFDVDWEYYDGGSWSALTVRDDTESFTQPGLKVVSWQIPDDWERTTINSVNAYWVRAEITSLSGTFIEPEVNTSHPHVIATPYVDLPADMITGDLAALARLHIRNEGGPFDDTQALRITAGANDVLANHGGSSITTNATNAVLQNNYSLGLRFENVQIPQGAKLYFARLFLTPLDNSTQGIAQQFYTDVYCEDYDNATLWTDYTDYNNRTLTTAKGTNSWEWRYWDQNADDGVPEKVENIYGAIQEVIDRPGWASGNALHFRFKEYTDDGYDGWPASAFRTVGMYENSSDSWQLEVAFVQNETYTTTIVAGTRNLSRGDLFNAYINMRPRSQNGIEVSGASFLGDSSVAVPNRTAIIFSADDPLAPSFVRRGIVRIPNPLAEQYAGTFRVFLRASHDTNLSGTYETSFRLVFKAGATVFSTKIVESGSSVPQFIDVGQVTIPPLTNLDNITIDIYAARPDYSVGATEKVYIHDLVLMPADEWSGEFTSRSPAVSGQLNADLIMQIDSIQPTKGYIETVFLDENTELKKGALSQSANKLAFDPKEEQDYRLWLLAISDTYLDYTEEIFLSDETIERNGGLAGAVHSVQFYMLPTYLSLRGAK